MARFGATSTTGWKATVSVAMSNYIEAGSIIAIATSLGFWQAEFGIDDTAVGLLAAVSANAFGAAVGALIGGPLCDRYGRKFIYTYDLILYMVGILLAAFAFDVWMLGAAFVLTGIAVGAGVPASWTYIAEEAPAGRRAKHVGTAQLAWSMGPVVGFALATVLAPLGLLGSRLVFVHLFLVAFVVWWIRQGLHESVLWKESNSRALRTREPRRGLRELLSRPTNVRALVFLFGIYGFWGVCAGQMGIFMPRVYATAGVADPVAQNLLQVLLWSCTVLATWLGFMRFGDRVSRRLLYAAGAALGIVAWVLLVFAEVTLPVLLLFAVCWGVSAGIGAQAFYSLWASELFATPYRASAQGVLFFAARVAVGVLSSYFPTVLAAHGVPVVGLIMIALLLIALAVGAIWAPQTRGKTLQQIEFERYGELIAAAPRAGETARPTLG
ncbi:inositol transporter-like SP family MFS transporter [Rathayibacter sp. PhB151]|uniref:MFS transporter n=1 Tax=Rathayibacter sp. PhB151 TaxID=2485189 RepID=UPI001063023A|nr:MFS transporter [Rathayibacter sp. PhB151]TDX81691.1 inositol transporter-like SP family MFS transporter [Rathayibacter sp. PhB151]